MSTFNDEYAALTAGVGLIDVSDRTQLELLGEDRAAFLHNFTTNAIRDLKWGEGCEAFVLDARGHVLGHVFVFCTPHSLVLDTVPEEGEKLAAHFNRYLIRERVEIHDRSLDWGELLLAGPDAGPLLAGLGAPTPDGRLVHCQAELFGQSVWLRAVDLAGPSGWLIAGPRDATEPLRITLEAEGATPCGPQALETARIEAGFPWYGRDITDKNLPQEVNRDQVAISFTKGCYLGQETVARIDALGHVNKRLMSVQFSGPESPPPGTELTVGGAVAGEVTSAIFSPKLGSPLALVYIRRGHEAKGTKLSSAAGKAEVV